VAPGWSEIVCEEFKRVVCAKEIKFIEHATFPAESVRNSHLVVWPIFDRQPATFGLKFSFGHIFFRVQAYIKSSISSIHGAFLSKWGALGPPVGLD